MCYNARLKIKKKFWKKDAVKTAPFEKFEASWYDKYLRISISCLVWKDFCLPFYQYVYVHFGSDSRIYKLLGTIYNSFWESGGSQGFGIRFIFFINFRQVRKSPPYSCTGEFDYRFEMNFLDNFITVSRKKRQNRD